MITTLYETPLAQLSHNQLSKIQTKDAHILSYIWAGNLNDNSDSLSAMIPILPNVATNI